jgi:hypothetical protein
MSFKYPVIEDHFAEWRPTFGTISAFIHAGTGNNKYWNGLDPILAFFLQSYVYVLSSLMEKVICADVMKCNVISPI